MILRVLLFLLVHPIYGMYQRSSRAIQLKKSQEDYREFSGDFFFENQDDFLVEKQDDGFLFDKHDDGFLFDKHDDGFLFDRKDENLLRGAPENKTPLGEGLGIEGLHTRSKSDILSSPKRKKYETKRYLSSPESATLVGSPSNRVRTTSGDSGLSASPGRRRARELKHDRLIDVSTKNEQVFNFAKSSVRSDFKIVLPEPEYVYAGQYIQIDLSQFINGQPPHHKSVCLHSTRGYMNNQAVGKDSIIYFLVPENCPREQELFLDVTLYYVDGIMGTDNLYRMTVVVHSDSMYGDQMTRLLSTNSLQLRINNNVAVKSEECSSYVDLGEISTQFRSFYLTEIFKSYNEYSKNLQFRVERKDDLVFVALDRVNEFMGFLSYPKTLVITCDGAPLVTLVLKNIFPTVHSSEQVFYKSLFMASVGFDLFGYSFFSLHKNCDFENLHIAQDLDDDRVSMQGIPFTGVFCSRFHAIDRNGRYLFKDSGPFFITQIKAEATLDLKLNVLDQYIWDRRSEIKVDISIQSSLILEYQSIEILVESVQHTIFADDAEKVSSLINTECFIIESFDEWTLLLEPKVHVPVWRETIFVTFTAFANKDGTRNSIFQTDIIISSQ